MPTELAVTTLTGIVELVYLGIAIAAIDAHTRAKDEPRIRSIKYGSPFDVVLVLTGSATTILAIAAACTKVMNGMADFRLKFASTRKILAETDSIRVTQARQARASNWRIDTVSDPARIINPVPKPTPDLRQELFTVGGATASERVDLDAAELESAYIVQADRAVSMIVNRTANETSIRLSTREVKSITLLGAHDVEVRVVDEIEEIDERSN